MERHHGCDFLRIGNDPFDADRIAVLNLANVSRETQVSRKTVEGYLDILEDLMLELMYNLPAQRKVREFVVTAEMVRSREINWTLLEKAG